MQNTTKPTILIADANVQNRKTFCAQLSQEYTIFEAEHGLQLLQMMEKQAIGAVHYDYAFPGLNAKEFLLLRQDNPSLETIPTFVFAGHQDAEPLLEFKPTFLIFRPYDLKVLKERIRSVSASKLQSGFALYNDNVRIAMANHTSFSFSIGMKPNASHGSELFFYASWIPYSSLPDPVFIVMVLDPTRLIERNPLMGIYNQDTFYRKTEALPKHKANIPHLFIRWDIERFGTVNDLLGNSAGNEILSGLGDTFIRLLDEDRPTVPIAINLSRSDFYNQDLAQNIIEKPDRYAIPHSLLMFEITESVYSENPKELMKVMRTLQKEGFLILMDDFGSGYSSLNVLKDVPIDILKLDSMFSGEIGKPERAGNIIRSIVSMASLQGFYFSKPLPIEQFLSLDMVHNRPAFITGQFFQHMESFSLSNMQSKVLRTLFDEIYLFNYSEDLCQQLYTNPHLTSPPFTSQGSLSSFLSLVREKRILPQDRDSFLLFSQTKAIGDDQESLKQRFRWMDSKGEETTGSWSLIKMDNPSHKDLFLCCINVVDAGCGIGGDYCSYKSRYAMIEKLANIKVMEWDIEQDILYKSPNLELLQLGKISPKALLDKHYCIPFIHEEDLATCEESVEKAVSEPRQSGTTVRLRLLNGEFRWFNIQMHMCEQIRSSRRKLDFLTTSAQWGIVIGYLSLLQEGEGELLVSFMQTKQDFQLTVHITQKDHITTIVQLSVLFSPIDQVRKEFICYLFTLNTEEPGYEPSENTTSEMTIPPAEKIAEGLSQHRQMKNPVHISLEW